MQVLRGVLVVLAAGTAVGGVIAAGAGPASSQEPPGDPAVTADVVAAAIAEDGWYADAGAVGDREQLAHVADRLARGSDPMGFALLAADPAGPPTAFAEDVLDALPAHGERAIATVVVLSGDVDVVSDTWSDQAIDDALDETIDDLRADRTDGLEALADALAAEPTGFDDTGDTGDTGSDGGGSNAGWIGIGVVALVVLSVGSRYLSGPSDGDTYDDGGSYGGSSWSRRRRSFSRSSSRRRRSSSSRSSRRSSSGARRGRGSRRL